MPRDLRGRGFRQVQRPGDGDGDPIELAEEMGSLDPLLEQLVLALDGVLRRWEPSARTYADQVGAMVAAQLARAHSVRSRPLPAVAPRAGLIDRQFAAVRELMEERLAEPIPLADMAAVVGLSVSQFARQFKARTGLTPHRYLVQRRLDRACRLLMARELPIADVAAHCGFSHQEHLTRVMRAVLHTTPAAVRRG